MVGVEWIIFLSIGFLVALGVWMFMKFGLDSAFLVWLKQIVALFHAPPGGVASAAMASVHLIALPGGRVVTNQGLKAAIELTPNCLLLEAFFGGKLLPEVIEQIKALPPEEKAQVVDFVCQMAAPPPSISRVIRYASPEQVRAAAEKVFREHEEVFRRLAQ